MNNVKSWKKNFKKTGALALATLVMCGSASFVRAEDITLNGGGNEHAVYGYQTGEATGYAANITWGNMKFVYDNGNYNPTVGAIESTLELENMGVEAGAQMVEDGRVADTLQVPTYYITEDAEKIYYKYKDSYYSCEDGLTEFNGTEDQLTYCGDEEIYRYQDEYGNEYYQYYPSDGNEVYFSEEDHTLYAGGVDALTPMTTPIYRCAVGLWYGFNGENNAVTVENLSTAGITIKVASSLTENETIRGATKFSFYVVDDSSTTDLDGGELTVDNGSNFGVKHSVDGTCRFAEAGVSLKRQLNAASLKNTGELMENGTEAATIYLNITGKPGDDFSKSAENTSDIGKIVLSFETEGTEPLTPVNPTDGE